MSDFDRVKDFVGCYYDDAAHCFVSGVPPYLSAGDTECEAVIAAIDALRLASEVLAEKLKEAKQ